MSDEQDNPLDAIEIAKASRDFAALLRAHYLNLVDEGFSVQEALAITISYQVSMLDNSRS